MLVILAAAGATPGDEPTLREGLESDQVTPGLLGFLLTFFIVIVTFFLIRDMTKRIRRVRYREQVFERGNQADGPSGDLPPAGSEGGSETAGQAPAGDSEQRAGQRARSTQGHDDGAPRGGKHGPDSEFPDSKPRS